MKLIELLQRHRVVYMNSSCNQRVMYGCLSAKLPKIPAINRIKCYMEQDMLPKQQIETFQSRFHWQTACGMSNLNLQVIVRRTLYLVRAYVTRMSASQVLPKFRLRISLIR